MTTIAIPTSPAFRTTSERSIDSFSMPTEWTVAQAAKLLDMSEGCVNGLLNDGIIEFRLENGERRIQRDSLLEFETEYREQGEALSEIAQWSQEMGLYD
jgi:hypothetical protein